MALAVASALWCHAVATDRPDHPPKPIAADDARARPADRGPAARDRLGAAGHLVAAQRRHLPAEPAARGPAPAEPAALPRGRLGRPAVRCAPEVGAPLAAGTLRTRLCRSQPGAVRARRRAVRGHRCRATSTPARSRRGPGSARFRAGSGARRSIAHGSTSREAERRVRLAYWPYHHALQRLLHGRGASSAWSLLLDCHSMPSFAGDGAADHDGSIDFALGDRFGRSCSAGDRRAGRGAAASQGFRVARNRPYAGGHITARYGRPKAGVHALQLEAPPGPVHGGAAPARRAEPRSSAVRPARTLGRSGDFVAEQMVPRSGATGRTAAVERPAGTGGWRRAAVANPRPASRAADRAPAGGGRRHLDRKASEGVPDARQPNPNRGRDDRRVSTRFPYHSAGAPAVLTLNVASACGAAETRHADLPDVCGAIADADRDAPKGFPSGLVRAVTLAESGRWLPEDRRTQAWPWTVTAGADELLSGVQTGRCAAQGPGATGGAAARTSTSAACRSISAIIPTPSPPSTRRSSRPAISPTAPGS